MLRRINRKEDARPEARDLAVIARETLIGATKKLAVRRKSSLQTAQFERLSGLEDGAIRHC